MEGKEKIHLSKAGARPTPYFMIKYEEKIQQSFYLHVKKIKHGRNLFLKQADER